MKLKPKIIFYGAFDRYNYGDNLMPILLEKYFLDLIPSIYEYYDLIFSSILKSDLSQYACKPTTPISDLLDTPNNSLLIVVGGETMGATINGLYLHTFSNKWQHRSASFFSKYFKLFFIAISFLRYRSPWYYSYIPNKKLFKNKINIVLNTVGGIPSRRASNSLESIDYISVRDLRTFEGMKNNFDVKLVPDSVLLLSRLYNIDALEKLSRKSLLEKFDFEKEYIVIQMCPYKASCDPKDLAKTLMDIKDKGIETVLLPIGYASGHDDVEYLRKVQNFSGNKLSLFYELTVWEIAYFIAKSKGFYGTSLHGVITAMSYEVPHFCINEKLAKLSSFMDTWSIPPFSKPIKPLDIITFLDIDYDLDHLNKKVNYAQNLIEQHYQFILDSYVKGNVV